MTFAFVCRFNPWRLDGGALIRNTWLVRALAAAGHRVHLITAGDPSEQPDPEFARVCASITRFPGPAGPRLTVARMTGAAHPGASLFTSGIVTPAMRAHLADLLARDCDAVMLDIALVSALPPGDYPVVFNAHNCEWQLLSRRAMYESPLVKAMLLADARRVREIERRLVARARLTAACSTFDRAALERLAPQAADRIVVTPNGVDVTRYASLREGAETAAQPQTILVTGTYDWRPNLIGLDWFIGEVVPALRTRTSAAIRVAGRMDEALVRRLQATPGVTAVPHPRDIRDELQTATVVAAPILASSGTRLRILEAWAATRPVVTTTPGAFGLEYENGRELLVADGTRPYADALAGALESPEQRAGLRREGLAAAQRYDWRRIAERFVVDLDRLVA